MRAVVRVAFSRWQVERCFQDCKTELGLNHAELRNYRGLHRHLILTAINYYFLQDRLGLLAASDVRIVIFRPACPQIDATLCACISEPPASTSSRSASATRRCR